MIRCINSLTHVQFEVLIEMGALRLERTGQLRSKYTVLLGLEAIKYGHGFCVYDCHEEET
jgi:hypothetical protein